MTKGTHRHTIASGIGFKWSVEKDEYCRNSRDVGFKDVVAALADGHLLDILEHQNPARYPRQRVLVVRIRSYVRLVPYIEEGSMYFLKTIIPSRKATRTYADVSGMQRGADH